jgi:hypothetical protein
MFGYTNSIQIRRLWVSEIGDANSCTPHKIARCMTSTVLNTSFLIFDQTKISRQCSPETEVLTKVLRAILLDLDTELTEHKNSYPSDELVNKEYIKEDQEALRSGIDVLVAPKSG